MSPVDDDRGELKLCGVDIGRDRICPLTRPCPTHDPAGHLIEEVLTTPPNPDGSVTLKAPRPRFMLEVKGGDAGTPDGPGEPGYVKITPVPPETVETTVEHFTAPATDTGRVDFREMLKTDAAWGLRERVNAVLGRPYLSTQLAAVLPVDVLLRLTERLEHLIHEAVQRELDKLHDELDAVTAATLARLAAQADTKLEELRRERFGANPAHRWGG